ncbi:hypothetical protein HYW17_00035 [Candidatus Uhrbacteria bacterium]|nr:hypothetical protein [Candidatus Uhrbacteria bacterium]
MVTTNDLLAKVNIHSIAEEGKKIYARIKNEYDPKEKGKFLAIDIESKHGYLGTTSAEALAQAREHHPDRVFYVVKIGYDVAETMVQSFLKLHA